MLRHLAPWVLLTGCIGLDTYKKDADPGRDIDSHDSFLETGGPLDSVVDGNSAPTADAGDDQQVSATQVVDLDGTGSSDPDMDGLTYAWELTELPSGSAAELINETRANPSFVPDVGGRYVATLTVSDGALDDSDEVEITATMTNGDPAANAGADQVVAIGAFVTLDGSGSADPEGDTLAYVWTMSSRPGGSAASLASSSTRNPTFTADLSGNYEISLTVSDGANYSTADTVRVRAEDSGGGSTGGSSDCGCGTAPDALGTSLLVGLLFMARAGAQRKIEKSAPHRLTS